MAGFFFFLIHNDSLGERYITSLWPCKILPSAPRSEEEESNSITIISVTVGIINCRRLFHCVYPAWFLLMGTALSHLTRTHSVLPPLPIGHTERRGHMTPNKGNQNSPVSLSSSRPRAVRKDHVVCDIDHLFTPKRAVLRMKLMSDSTGESVTEHPQNTTSEPWIQPRLAFGVLETEKTLSGFEFGFCYFQLKLPWLVNWLVGWLVCFCFLFLVNTLTLSKRAEVGVSELSCMANQDLSICIPHLSWYRNLK